MKCGNVPLKLFLGLIIMPLWTNLLIQMFGQKLIITKQYSGQQHWNFQCNKQMWEASLTLGANIFPPTEALPLGYG